MLNGTYLKQLRLSRKYTLKKLAEETGYSVGFLSQIERGLKKPSLSALRRIADCFNIPPTWLFQPALCIDTSSYQQNSPVQIVHKDMRQTIDIPKVAATVEVIPFFSPVRDNAPVIQGAVCSLAANKWCSETMMAHYKDQCIYVSEGSITFEAQHRSMSAHEGDCIFVKAETPYNFQCTSDKDCQLLIFSV